MSNDNPQVNESHPAHSDPKEPTGPQPTMRTRFVVLLLAIVGVIAILVALTLMVSDRANVEGDGNPANDTSVSAPIDQSAP